MVSRHSVKAVFKKYDANVAILRDRNAVLKTTVQASQTGHAALVDQLEVSARWPI